MYTHIYVYIHIYAYTHICTDLCIYMYVYRYVFFFPKYTYIYIYIYIFILMNTQAHTHIYIYIYTCTYICVYYNVFVHGIGVKVNCVAAERIPSRGDVRAKVAGIPWPDYLWFRSEPVGPPLLGKTSMNSDVAHFLWGLFWVYRRCCHLIDYRRTFQAVGVHWPWAPCPELCGPMLWSGSKCKQKSPAYIIQMSLSVVFWVATWLLDDLCHRELQSVPVKVIR